ncbi:hypothetical protein [Pseudofulvimonas gallinarii]|uniref:hypothetical protein n=1 Tax=Pseudofulvimonas gallinarii TaxID=634155 RepID=UPI0035E8B376
MNVLDTLRSELRRMQAQDFALRLHRELAMTPDDPDLRWALRELQSEIATRGPSRQRRARDTRTQAARSTRDLAASRPLTARSGDPVSGSVRGTTCRHSASGRRGSSPRRGRGKTTPRR